MPERGREELWPVNDLARETYYFFFLLAAFFFAAFLAGFFLAFLAGIETSFWSLFGASVAMCSLSLQAHHLSHPPPELGGIICGRLPSCQQKNAILEKIF